MIRFISKIWVFFILLRPVNVVIVAVAVVIGGMLCGSSGFTMLPVVISAAMILAAGNVLNDIADANVDRIAHPERPIASGKISRKTALTSSVLMFTTGMFFASLASVAHLILSAFAVLLLVLYSLWLSGIPVVGNITIAVLAGASMIYGGIYHICEKNIFAAVLAFFLHLPREIFKDIQDIDGDVAESRITLPVWVGTKFASRIGAVMCIVAMIIIEIPFIVGIFGFLYNAVASVSFVLCGMAAVFGFGRYARTAQKLLKFAMIVGVVALMTEIHW